MSAPVRQSSLLCGAPRRTEAWAVADRAGERRRPGDASLLRRHARSSRPCFAPRAARHASSTSWPRREGGCDIVRLVRGVQGDVAMRMELVTRFDYGSIVPWVSRQGDGRLRFIAGPDRLLLDTNVSTRGEGFRTLAEFTVSAGQEASFILNWSPSFTPVPAAAAGGRRIAAGPRVLVGLGHRAQALQRLRRRGVALAPDVEGARALGRPAASSRRARPRCRSTEKAGGSAQLGLSLLLAARRDFHASGADKRGFPRRSPRVAPMASARRRRLS